MDKKVEEIRRLLASSLPDTRSEEEIRRLLASIPPDERARVLREAIASEFIERF